MKSFKKYYHAVNFLESLLNLPIKNYLLDLGDRSYYLKRLGYLLKLLGDPQNDFKFIHITGTAGKGTVSNYLHEILTGAGSRVGSYFSPHPTTTIERVKVNQQYISPQELALLTNHLKPYLIKAALNSPYGQPSYFETLLALALLYFKKKKCEYVILEAGLGGTHDATNIISQTKLAIITNIDYDHTEILGASLKKIAQDKAGIIKSGSTFLTGETRPALLKIFQQRCRKVNANFLRITKKSDDVNKALAFFSARHLKIADKFISQGLIKANLPCRFEIIQKRPLVILDGAHNPAKLAYLRKKLANLKYRKLNIVYAQAADKNLKDSLKTIVPLADKLWLTRFLMPWRKTADLKTLYQLSKKIKPELTIIAETDPWQALKLTLAQTKPNDCLLITGSFFLAGELRKNWIKEEYILTHRTSFKT